MKLTMFLILVISLFDANAKNNCQSDIFQEENYCVIAGGSSDTSKSINMGHSRSLALKTARILAYEKMAEKIKGITLKSYSKVGNDLLNENELKTLVEATLKNISFEKETLAFLPDGSPWAEVTISVPKMRFDSASTNILDYSNGHSKEDREKVYVIDLRGSKSSLSLNFKIKSLEKTLYEYNPMKSDIIFINTESEIKERKELHRLKPISSNNETIELNEIDGAGLNNDIFTRKINSNNPIYILR